MGSTKYLLDERGCPVSEGFHSILISYQGIFGSLGKQRFRLDDRGRIIEALDGPYPADSAERNEEFRTRMCPVQ